jgi:ABC-type transport system involved in multi-copper enzyme maturation permease subunit
VRARLHAARTIAARDLLGLATSPGPYVVLAIGMLATFVILRGHIDAVVRGQIILLADAFTLPYFITATIAMLFLAIASATAVARERDQGTLETLFHGPVDAPSYLAGKQLAQVGAFAAVALSAALLLVAYAGVTGFRVTGMLALAVLLSIPAAGAVVALGLFLSTATGSVRAAVTLLVAVTALLLAIRVAADLLGGIVVANNQSPLLFARDLFVVLDAIAARLSPFALFQDGVDAASRGEYVGYVMALGIALVHVAALMWAAIRLLEARGVRG